MAFENIDYTFINIRDKTLTEELLQRWITTLNWQILINQRSTTWRQLKAEEKVNINNEKSKILMLTYPTIIKRPIFDDPHECLMVGFKKETQSILKRRKQ